MPRKAASIVAKHNGLLMSFIKQVCLHYWDSAPFLCCSFCFIFICVYIFHADNLMHAVHTVQCTAAALYIHTRLSLAPGCRVDPLRPRGSLVGPPLCCLEGSWGIWTTDPLGLRSNPQPFGGRPSQMFISWPDVCLIGWNTSQRCAAPEQKRQPRSQQQATGHRLD